jgi:hypothetical protein
MTRKKLAVLALIITLYTISCSQPEKNNLTTNNQSENFKKEKRAILETITNETKAAFERNYETWQQQWLHNSTITKTYMNFTDSTFSESVGWDTVSNFIKSYFIIHPKPEPAPKLIDDTDVRLYDNGAWVTFEQQDSIRGLKRETRLMEKENGQWKITGMHTAIYGFKKR